MSLEKYRSDFENCSRCSACKFIPLERVTDAEYTYGCPSIARHNFHAYSGGGRLSVGSALLDGQLVHDQKVAEIAYDCLLCGSCDVSCKYGMDMEVLEPLEEIRTSCVDAGYTSPALDDLVKRARESSATWLQPGGIRISAADLGAKDASCQRTEVLYHLGCQISHSGPLQSIARSTVGLLQKAGLDVGVFGEGELCCGGRVLEWGYREEFAAQADRLLASIRRSGAQLLVTSCAHCYQALTVRYLQAGKEAGVRVVHAADLLLELVEKGALQVPSPGAVDVTYHDPCHLGRLGESFVPWQGEPVPGHRRMYDPPKPWRRGADGNYDSPRRLLDLASGGRLKEMRRIKEYAWCCGGGGGVPESNAEFAAWTANERIREARATGAEILVTACPTCRSMLSQGGTEAETALRVLDISEFLASVTGEEGEV